MSDRAAQLRALMKAKSKGEGSDNAPLVLTGKEKLAYLKAKKEKELAKQAKEAAHVQRPVALSGNNSSAQQQPSAKQSRAVDISSLNRPIPPVSTSAPASTASSSSSSSSTSSSVTSSKVANGIGALSHYGDDEDDVDTRQQNLPLNFFDAAPATNMMRNNDDQDNTRNLPSAFHDSNAASSLTNTVSSGTMDAEQVEENVSTSALPVGFFDNPALQKTATGVDVSEQERQKKEKKDNATLNEFLQSVGEMPSGYEEADGGETSMDNNGNLQDIESNIDMSRETELLDQGLQLAYESKVLGLRERNEHMLTKRKGIHQGGHSDSEINGYGEKIQGFENVTSEKVKKDLEGIAREALHSMTESNKDYPDNDEDPEQLEHEEQSLSTDRAIDFTSVILNKKKKKKTIADNSGLSMSDGFMDWTAKSI